MLLRADYGDVLYAPTTDSLTPGTFVQKGDTFAFEGEHELYEYQGYGPYTLTDAKGRYKLLFSRKIVVHPIGGPVRFGPWEQPLYRYTDEGPVYSGYDRRVTYEFLGMHIDLFAGSGLPWLFASMVPKAAQALLKKYLGTVVCPECFTIIAMLSAAGFVNNTIQFEYRARMELVDRRTFWCSFKGCGPIPDESYGLWK